MRRSVPAFAASLLAFLPLTALLLAAPAAAQLAPEDAPRARREEPSRGGAEHATKVAKIEAAVVVLQPTGSNQVAGMVYFQRAGKGIRLTGTIKGLTPGKHGFHVHQYGDLTDGRTGASAGGHFDPSGMPHGDRESEERHVGDLGNIEANEEGVATIDLTDEHLAFEGPNSILGRALVVHEKADEFTQPAGDAGGRVAFGVIGVANPETLEARGQKNTRR